VTLALIIQQGKTMPSITYIMWSLYCLALQIFHIISSHEQDLEKNFTLGGIEVAR
jgi:hypothetical protein